MKIETKFDFGDRVYCIKQDHEQVLEKCSFCAGIGSINGADGTRKLCPECYGRKGKIVYKRKKWLIRNVLTIGQIKAEIQCAHDGEVSIFDNYGSQEEKRKIKYMAYETGIGSGSVYDEELLFATREQAQAECDKRNSMASKQY